MLFFLSEVVVKTHNRRAKELQGSNIFADSNDNLSKRQVSSSKKMEISGHSGIFGDDGGVAYKASTPSLRVSQPAGGRSTITFG